MQSYTEDGAGTDHSARAGPVRVVNTWHRPDDAGRQLETQSGRVFTPELSYDDSKQDFLDDESARSCGEAMVEEIGGIAECHRRRAGI
ncbi:hypothetical protein ABT88_11885 [Salmonella enterica subsp. enterica serovar Typhimurium]|nr:hypothetical protein ABT88_11885 [Salmonella enterica subsp. enterica serovar Typhimurium]